MARPLAAWASTHDPTSSSAKSTLWVAAGPVAGEGQFRSTKSGWWVKHSAAWRIKSDRWWPVVFASSPSVCGSYTCMLFIQRMRHLFSLYHHDILNKESPFGKNHPPQPQMCLSEDGYSHNPPQKKEETHHKHPKHTIHLIDIYRPLLSFWGCPGPLSVPYHHRFSANPSPWTRASTHDGPPGSADGTATRSLRAGDRCHERPRGRTDGTGATNNWSKAAKDPTNMGRCWNFTSWW